MRLVGIRGEIYFSILMSLRDIDASDITRQTDPNPPESSLLFFSFAFYTIFWFLTFSHGIPSPSWRIGVLYCLLMRETLLFSGFCTHVCPFFLIFVLGAQLYRVVLEVIF